MGDRNEWNTTSLAHIKHNTLSQFPERGCRESFDVSYLTIVSVCGSLVNGPDRTWK